MYIRTLLAWVRMLLLVIGCFGGSYYFSRSAQGTKLPASRMPKIDYRLSAVNRPLPGPETR
ncbi:hypothetical protein [Hymenobacter fodinae]|uniref:Uncharacterized protein n=1 Tax=Hymenobacter fodinae TaxID=2510796 RepID=A0A4Z0P7C3_9BACT|nr:hypothetical protein [Hymenobacter fodinae]TGE06568.1 hypothetical protein EU556_17195 [Hymenobacter fodinae]